jgi:hypothetical protein
MDISAIASPSFAIIILPPDVAKFRGTGNEVSCWSLRPLTQDKVVGITAEFLTSRQSPTICQNQTSCCTTTGEISEMFFRVFRLQELETPQTAAVSVPINFTDVTEPGLFPVADA